MLVLQEQLVLRWYHTKRISEFCLLYCDQDSSIDYAQRTSKGSTMPYAVWEGGLGEMEINIPPQQIAEEFNMLVLPYAPQNSIFLF